MSNQYFGDDRIVHEPLDVPKAPSHRIYSDSEASDDIVTRLRESNGMTNSRSDDGFMSIHPDTDLMRQAADEIERLRAELGKWRQVAEQLAESDPRFDAFHTYFQAVRGG